VLGLKVMGLEHDVLSQRWTGAELVRAMHFEVDALLDG